MGLRVALIIHQFLPRHAAGTEQLTLKLALALRAREIDVVIVTAEPTSTAAPTITHDSIDGVPVLRLHGIAIHDPFVGISNPTADGLLREALERVSPDLVHVFHFSHVGIGVINVVDALRVPMVFTATDFWWRCPLARLQAIEGTRCNGPGLLGARCLRHRLVLGFRHGTLAARVCASVPSWLYAFPLLVARTASSFLPLATRAAELSRRQDHLRRHAQRIGLSLAPTAAVRDEMLLAGFHPDRVRLLPFGIDAPEAFHSDDAARPFTIGFIGTLRSHKGAHFLLEAAGRLPADTKARIQIYGDRATDTAYAESLDKLARASTIPVTFEGAFAENRFGRVLAGLDVVVVPSLWMENRPLVLLSSLLSRKPVVVTDQPGLTCEVVHGENGLVVPPNDADALAKSLYRLSQDTGLREHLASHPRRPMRMDLYVDALQAIYREVARPTFR
ncbi:MULTISPECIES: glycosyltransferase [Hyphomicrobiales]|uniref:glycosyltransferase n=1 Tax=Methylobacterium sp. CCH7-A2 TaxID=1768789 RepID=UPI00083395DC|nr:MULTISPECIES: glycosyltransferase [Hyphomicrobiales]